MRLSHDQTPASQPQTSGWPIISCPAAAVSAPATAASPSRASRRGGSRGIGQSRGARPSVKLTVQLWPGASAIRQWGSAQELW